MNLTPDELEYAISQYLDGTLPPLERAALDERLAVDADARAILAEYRTLDASLKSLPLPALAWERVAAQIQQAIAQEEAPIPHYSLRPMRWIGCRQASRPIFPGGPWSPTPSRRRATDHPA